MLNDDTDNADRNLDDEDAGTMSAEEDERAAIATGRTIIPFAIVAIRGCRQSCWSRQRCSACTTRQTGVGGYDATTYMPEYHSIRRPRNRASLRALYSMCLQSHLILV